MPVEQLDSYSPPSDANLAAAKSVDIWTGYIGGPECAAPTGAGGWDAAAFARVRAHRKRAPGIYVGIGSPTEAVTLAAARGIPRGEVIWHDIETGYAQSHLNDSVADWWASGVRSMGWVPGLYGTATFANAMGRHYDASWLAGGDYYRDGPGKNPWPATPLAVPRCTPNRRPCGVQWWATHDEFGISVDRSVMDDYFGVKAPSTGDDLDVQTAQYLAITQFLNGLGRVPSVSDMATRGQRILDIGTLNSYWEITGSPEGVATGGLPGALAGLVARLNAVEAHLADVQKQGMATYDPAPVQAEVDRVKSQVVALVKALADGAASAQAAGTTP